MMGETNEPERRYVGATRVLCSCGKERPVMERCSCVQVSRGPGYPARLALSMTGGEWSLDASKGLPSVTAAYVPVNVRQSTVVAEALRQEAAHDARDAIIADLQAKLAALQAHPAPASGGKPVIPARTLSAPMAQRIGLITGWRS